MGKPLIGLVVLALLSATPALAIDLDDVINMLEADVSEDVILRVIDSEGARFYITSEDILDLRYAGASDWFLDEILDRRIKTSRSQYRHYHVHDPYHHYVSIGIVYDPFDYYFVSWPYYYAYVSPFRFSWTWWYYGGPYHHHWWGPSCWRVRYYDHSWGSRTIWDRGYRDRRYHVPRYDLSDKQIRRVVYDRSVSSREKTARYEGDRRRTVYDRPVGDRKTIRSDTREKRTRTDRPSRDRTSWGRKDRGDQPKRSDKPSKPQVRTPRPSRQSTPAKPSKPQVSPQRPSRSSSPAPSRQSSPSRPSRPSRGSSSPSRPTRS